VGALEKPPQGVNPQKFTHIKGFSHAPTSYI